MTSAPKAKQAVIRLEQSVCARADALVAHITRARGHISNRTEVLREAIMRGLKELEREQQRDEAGR